MAVQAPRGDGPEPRALVAALFLHAIGAVTWFGVFAFSVAEGTPNDGSVSYLGFWVATGVAGALWLAAAVLMVMEWRLKREIWWAPFAWWVASYILAIVIWAQIQG
jgi:hypothetical protein